MISSYYDPSTGDYTLRFASQILDFHNMPQMVLEKVADKLAEAYFAVNKDKLITELDATLIKGQAIELVAKRLHDEVIISYRDEDV